MRSQLKLLLVTGSLVAASLGASVSAGAATAAPPAKAVGSHYLRAVTLW